MVSYRYPIIAKEGWWLITIFLVFAIIVNIFINTITAVIFWLIVVALLVLFRDPVRVVPAIPLGIVAPVDGEIIAIGHIQDPYLPRQAQRIVIQMGRFSIFSVRSPMEGKVIKQWLNSPQLNKTPAIQTESISASEKQANRHFAQWIQSDEQDDVVMAVNHNSILQRPRCYVHSGERIGQGQRCGMVPSHSCVEVLIPESAKLGVTLGQQISAGSDIIAKLVH